MATNALGEPLADAFEIAEGIEFALNIIVAAHPSPPPRPPPLAQSASDADTAALDAFLAYTEFARSLEQGAFADVMPSPEPVDVSEWDADRLRAALAARDDDPPLSTKGHRRALADRLADALADDAARDAAARRDALITKYAYGAAATAAAGAFVAAATARARFRRRPWVLPSGSVERFRFRRLLIALASDDRLVSAVRRSPLLWKQLNHPSE